MNSYCAICHREIRDTKIALKLIHLKGSQSELIKKKKGEKWKEDTDYATITPET